MIHFTKNSEVMVIMFIKKESICSPLSDLWFLDSIAFTDLNVEWIQLELFCDVGVILL